MGLLNPNLSRIWKSGERPDRNGEYKEINVVVTFISGVLRESTVPIMNPRIVTIDLYNRTPGARDRLPPTQEPNRGWKWHSP